VPGAHLPTGSLAVDQAIALRSRNGQQRGRPRCLVRGHPRVSIAWRSRGQERRRPAVSPLFTGASYVIGERDLPGGSSQLVVVRSDGSGPERVIDTGCADSGAA